MRTLQSQVCNRHAADDHFYFTFNMAKWIYYKACTCSVGYLTKYALRYRYIKSIFHKKKLFICYLPATDLGFVQQSCHKLTNIIYTINS